MPFQSRDDDYSPLGEQDEFSKTFNNCSMKTRIMGFVICCGVGWVISILGVLSLIIKHNVTQFAILYSIGQVLNIVGYYLPNYSSCFLATPKKQFKNMTDRTRIVLTALYLGAIVLTLVLGLLLPENLTFLVFLSLIGQMVAYFFYTLSYIPFGRKILKKICRFMV